jgi:hypothetical protein
MANADEIRAWFGGRLPTEWTEDGEATITVDRDEITVIVTISEPDVDDDEAVRSEALAGRVAGWRDDTKQQRIRIAREAERRYEQKVAWGVQMGDHNAVFTHLAVPTMTRLRQPERQVLDTLIAAGVARSRADALAWCVKLVGKHTDEWLAQLREAIDEVDRIRAEGPAA